jgi:hypothetical protein
VTFGSSSSAGSAAEFTTSVAPEASSTAEVLSEEEAETVAAWSSSSSSGVSSSKSRQRGNGTKPSSKASSAKAAPKRAKAACKPLHASAPAPVLTAITKTSLEGYTIKELKGLLAERRLPVSGKKSELIERLEDYLEEHEQDEEEEEEFEDEEEGSEEEGDDDIIDENENPTAATHTTVNVISDQEPASQKLQHPPRKVVIGKLGGNNTFGLSLALHSPGRWDRDNADTEEYM